ncbi:MAG TPA: hypothetical protein ENN27_05145, partial [Candidatus Atribacteria bacterium]|nr:hypothetical protein [Candidatus Atribacteria bacterium]
MKKILIFLIIGILCFTSYLIGYNTTTTTTNLSLVKIASGDETVDWFDNANTNLDLIDAAFNDVLAYDTTPVLRGNLDVGTFSIEGVDATEFGYLDGVTSGVQAQLDNKQPLDAQLTDIAGLTPTDGCFIVGDGVNFITETGATVRTSLGLAIGTDVQAYDAGLLSLADLTYVSDGFIKATATDVYAIRTIAETKTDLSLNLVENTALSTWAGTANVTTLGTIGTGTWNATVISAAKGGTGVANDAANTIAFTGAYSLGLILSANTALTLPTSGTVATTSNKLSAFAATTSAELAEVISDEIGEGKLRFDTSVTTKTTTATLTVAEAGTILVSASEPYTITLPTAVGNTGLTYHFIKTDANYNLITLDGNGNETFNYENSTGAPCSTYTRLNTYCAEVTIVSDGSNWQCINEKLGQVPECKVYLANRQYDVTNNAIIYVEHDTKVYDIGNNYNISTWASGNATETTANHLIDTTTSPFEANMVGKRVKNTTDATFTYITAYNSTSDVTVRDDIFKSGDAYEIKHSKFVAPIAGKYQFIHTVGFTDVVADKKWSLGTYKNYTTNIGGIYSHSSITDTLLITV